MGWFLRLKRPPCQEHRCKQVLCGRVKRRTQRDLKVPGERRKPLRGDLFSTPHRYTTIGMASRNVYLLVLIEVKYINQSNSLTIKILHLKNSIYKGSR